MIKFLIIFVYRVFQVIMNAICITTKTQLKYSMGNEFKLMIINKN